MDYVQENFQEDLPYENLKDINFGIITMGIKRFPFFDDDLWLGMQGMNVGFADAVITPMEYDLSRELFQSERTPVESAMAVGALSQMWVYGLYEALRMWRDRRYNFNTWLANGGIEQKIANMPDDEFANATIDVRRRQLIRFKDDQNYRNKIALAWGHFEPVYRSVELFRMNLAKHSAPGKNGVIPRAPGYGRINRWCGALDYELIEGDGCYQTMSRRDIADLLRKCINAWDSAADETVGAAPTKTE